MQPKINFVIGQGSHAGGKFVQQFSALHGQSIRKLQPADLPEVSTEITASAHQPFFYTVNACYPTKSVFRNFCEQSGKPHFTQEMPLAVQRALQQGHAYLIIDSSNEGPFAAGNYLSELHEIAAQLNISPCQIFWLHQNLAFADYYSDWADRRQIAATDRLRIRYYHSLLALFTRTLLQEHGESFQSGAYSADLSDPTRLRPKRFLCLNNTPRDHRVFMVLKLMEQQLLDQGLVSLRGLKHERKESFSPDSKSYRRTFPHHLDLLALLPDLEQRLPLIADDTSDQNAIIKTLNLDLYRQTYFSFVTETEMSHGACRRFTEKSLKPLAAMHPFLVAGNSGTLQLLRDMGFRTFDGLIDESYDQIADPEQRAIAVFQEVQRLCAMPMSDLHQWYLAAQPILQHNVNHCFQTLSTWVERQMGEALLAEFRQLSLPLSQNSLSQNSLSQNSLSQNSLTQQPMMPSVVQPIQHASSSYDWCFTPESVLKTAAFNIVVSERHQLAYVPSPKCACTTLKTLIYELEHGQKFRRYKLDNGKTGNIHSFYKKSIFPGLEKFENYFKFAVIRDPIKRFLSAYSNRVLHHHELDSTKIPTKIQQKITAAGLVFNPEINLFVEKMEYYMDASASIRHHLSPQACFMGDRLDAFDWVGKLEELDHLVEKIAQRLSLPIALPHLQTGGQKLEMSILSPASMAKLIEFYAVDYELFQGFYAPPDSQGR